jgi:hypothetical protein
MNAWQEYKKKLGETRPWDLLNPNVERATDELAINRLKTCEECDSLIKATRQCKECGCVMPLKVKLKAAVCPLGKW